MPRHSAHLDEKLLKTGLELIASDGLKSLTVRKVCQKAGVNLGMFSYFFKDKDTYLKYLFKTIYIKLDLFWGMDQVAELDSLQRLKHFCKRSVCFAYENMYLLRAIMVDFATDEIFYRDCVQKGLLHSNDLLLQLIQSAQQDGYITSEISAEELHEYLTFSIIFPPLFPTIPHLPKAQMNPKDHDLEYYYTRCDKIFKGLEIKRDE